MFTYMCREIMIDYIEKSLSCLVWQIELLYCMKNISGEFALLFK